MFRHHRRLAAAVAIGAASIMFTAGCGAGDTGTDPDEPIELTFWSWLPNIQATVDLYEEAHPNVTVNVENVGAGPDQYTKLQNAADAGTGGPDVAQMGYETIPNFAISGALADLNTTGGESISDTFLPGVVSLVQQGEGIYGVPQDFGPAVLYYRHDIFEAAGVEVPATWDEFADAAEAIRAYDAETSITFLDPGLSAFGNMGLWQLDAQPWSLVSDDTVNIDMATAQAQQWADYWTDLNQRDLLAQGTMGSDEWFKDMGDGSIASWLVGAWGLQALTNNLPDSSGLWRVAPQPMWDEGDPATSQFGGSATVVMEQSEHAAAATEFALWLNSDPVAVESLKNDSGLLPTSNAAWADEGFLDEPIEYLGDQPARQIFAESAENTVVSWEWLPFQPYVDSIYAETVGQAIASQGDLNDGLAEWEARVEEYAQEQGFTVE